MRCLVDFLWHGVLGGVAATGVLLHCEVDHFYTARCHFYTARWVQLNLGGGVLLAYVEQQTVPSSLTKFTMSLSPHELIKM